jgi:hypothetical protein
MIESETAQMAETDWTQDPRWGEDFVEGGAKRDLDRLLDKRIDQIAGPTAAELEAQCFRYGREFQRLIDAYGEDYAAPTNYVSKLKLPDSGDFLRASADGREAGRAHPWVQTTVLAEPGMGRVEQLNREYAERQARYAATDWTKDPRWGEDLLGKGSLDDLAGAIKYRITKITARENGPDLHGQVFRWARERARLAALWNIEFNSDELEEWSDEAGYDIQDRLDQLLIPEAWRRRHPGASCWEWFDTQEDQYDAWSEIYTTNVDEGSWAGRNHPYQLQSAFETIDTLMDEDAADSRWLVEGAWPEGGKIVLSSPAKSGKTTFIGNVCRSLLDGEALLDHFPLKPLAENETILIFDTEMTKMQLHHWYEDQGLSPAARSRVRFKLLRGEKWDPRKTQALLIDQMIAEKVKVVIIDPIGPIMRRLNLNQDRDPDVGPLLAAFEDMMVKANLRGLLVSHHHGHVADRAMGAQVFRAWPDAEWSMTRKDNARFLTMQGRDVELPESLLGYDAASRRLSIEGGDRVTVASAAEAKHVPAIVHAQPGINATELKAALHRRGVTSTDDKVRLIASAKGEVHSHEGAHRAKLYYPGQCTQGCSGLPVGPTRAAGFQVQQDRSEAA